MVRPFPPVAQEKPLSLSHSSLAHRELYQSLEKKEFHSNLLQLNDGIYAD